MVSDCGCGSGSGTVEATRLKGRAAGVWGTARAGETVTVPKSVVRAHPDLWDWPGKHPDAPVAPERPAAPLEDLSGLTVPELRQKAAEQGVVVPSKARKAEIIAALGAASS